MQLTWTDAVFSRNALVSSFCAENQLSGKIPENTPKILFHEKTPGARRRDGGGLGPGHTTWPRGLAQAAPGGGLAAPDTPSVSLFAYKKPSNLKTLGGGGVRRFSKRSSAPPPPPDSTKQHQKLRSGTLPGRGIGGDHHHHHHHRFSIDHPCFPHL